MPPIPTRSIRLWLAIAVAFAVLSGAAGGLSRVGTSDSDTGGASGAARAAAPVRVGPTIPPEISASKGEDFISYVEPGDFLIDQIARERAGPGASPAEVAQAAEDARAEWSREHFHGPSPEAHQALLAREQVILGNAPDTAGGTGDAPDGADTPAAPLAPAVEGVLRLLVVAVEFDGEDTVESFSHEVGIRAGGRCVTETVTYSGPRHNEIAHPGPRDNHTTWLANFDRDFYEKMVFSSEGVTERLRPDLVDPEDGLPGIDIAGHSMATYYDEISGGKVTFDGGPKGVVGWVKVPHSVGYYAANPCRGGVPRGSGLPTNPNGTAQLIGDMIAAINAEDPDFPWADYDTDGNGVVDHVVIIHAGIDESEGGGIHGNQQIWAHRSSVPARIGLADDRGTPDDSSDDIRISGYTIQPENLSLGVLVHEFGHDLGLPDLYATTGDDDVTWWDLMSVGARTGRLNGSDPTHMGTWCKMVLGWSDPVVIDPSEDPEERVLGQLAQTPEGQPPAFRVDIPPTVIQLVKPPPGSTQMWWPGRSQGWADHKLWRAVDLSGVTGPVSLTFQADWVLEPAFDYWFLEVSVDAGQTFTQTKGYRAGTGQELTTPDDYGDPNGSLAAFGGLRYGYTGDSQGWVQVYHDLSAYAGRAIQVRLRYATDAGLQERGVFVDNFRLAAGGRTLWEDAVEGGDASGWTSVPGVFRGQLADAGWRLSDGTEQYPRYYLLEWRNPVGFDLGLKYAYNTVFSNVTPAGERELKVDRVPSNVPGMLVWLRDPRFDFRADSPTNMSILGDANLTALQSEGAKGSLLIVDANPEPLRGPLGGTFANAFGTFPFPPNDNWRGRVQTTNAAFSAHDTPPISLTVATGADLPDTTVMTATHYAPLPAMPAFHDALGHLPGVEALPEPITVYTDAARTRIKRYAFRDVDAGVVVPASGYYPPRTPAGFTGLGGETSPPSADVANDETMFLRGTSPAYVNLGAAGGVEVTGAQTGNPGDHGVHLGYHFEVVGEAEDGAWGRIRYWRARDAVEVTGDVAVDASGSGIDVSAGLRNIGGAGTLVLYSTFDATAAAYEPGSSDEPGIPVAAMAAEVVAAVALGGPDALGSLRVPPEEAKAVAWAGHVPSGEAARFGYTLAALQFGREIHVMHDVFPVEPSTAPRARWTGAATVGTRLFLPVARKGE